MTTEKKKRLFDKTYAELREAFVRGRFAEAFGREDMEHWGATCLMNPDDQNFDPGPLFSPALLKFGCAKVWGSRPRVKILGAFAERINKPLEALCHGDEHAAACLLSLQQGGCWFYIPRYDDNKEEKREFVISLGPMTMYVRVVLGAPMFLHIEHATDEYVLAVIRNEFLTRGPRFRSAQRHLQELVRRAIDEVRLLAVVDFHTAVAVSADGQKIVHADWVVAVHAAGREGAFRGWETFRIIPVERCRENKLLRSEQFIREKANASPRRPGHAATDEALRNIDAKDIEPERVTTLVGRIVNMYSRLLYGGMCFVEVEGKSGTRSTILITDVRLCPSGLLEGA